MSYVYSSNGFLEVMSYWMDANKICSPKTTGNTANIIVPVGAAMPNEA